MVITKEAKKVMPYEEFREIFARTFGPMYDFDNNTQITMGRSYNKFDITTFGISDAMSLIDATRLVDTLHVECFAKEYDHIQVIPGYAFLGMIDAVSFISGITERVCPHLYRGTMICDDPYIPGITSFIDHVNRHYGSNHTGKPFKNAFKMELKRVAGSSDLENVTIDDLHTVLKNVGDLWVGLMKSNLEVLFGVDDSQWGRKFYDLIVDYATSLDGVTSDLAIACGVVEKLASMDREEKKDDKVPVTSHNTVVAGRITKVKTVVAKVVKSNDAK